MSQDLQWGCPRTSKRRPERKCYRETLEFPPSWGGGLSLHTIIFHTLGEEGEGRLLLTEPLGGHGVLVATVLIALVLVALTLSSSGTDLWVVTSFVLTDDPSDAASTSA